MGSRAVISVDREAGGVIHTRTGRAFFDDDVSARLLANIAESLTSIGIWDELNTDWILLDAEIMPWSAKAGDLIRDQYAAVGAAARAALPATMSVLETAGARGLDLAELTARTGLVRPMRRRTSRPTVTTCGTSMVWTASGSLRSRCSPPTGRRTRSAITCGTWVSPIALSHRHLRSSHPLDDWSSRSTTRPRSRRGGVVERPDRGRRRGHGGQAAS